MPLLEVGSMDSVKTGFEVMPEEKLVKVRIAKPKSPEAELRLNKDGKSKTLSFGCEILEGQYKGRIVFWSTVLPTSKENYVAWNLKSDGQPMTVEQKEAAFEAGDYLRDLKLFATACGVNTSADIDTNDMYGKEITITVKQEVRKDTGEPKNIARNPKAIKA